MLAGRVVVDAVVHPYNLAPENWNPAAVEQVEAVHRFHLDCHDPANAHYALGRDEFFVDFDGDALTHALFAESPVDVAVLHALPNLGFTRGGITDPERVAELRERHPHRYRMYGTVDTPVVAQAISDLERQVRDYAIDGLKVYPAFYYDGASRGWRMDGADYATPLLEAVRDLGIRNVAVHKTLYMPPAPRQVFRVEDLDAALERFPDINFQIVHAGAAFVPETADLMSRHRNLTANLESTVAFLLTRPRLFAEIFGTFLRAAGPDQIVFGSGTNLIHARPVLEAFAGFEMPVDLVEQRGYPEVTDEIRAQVFGGNALRLYGLRESEVLAALRDDEFERAKADGYPSPWGVLRERHQAVGP
jgi:predicted TIM-barrel fold metal-dependent hydrolase